MDWTGFVCLIIFFHEKGLCDSHEEFYRVILLKESKPRAGEIILANLFSGKYPILVF
jgi:hypothetical protein